MLELIIPDEEPLIKTALFKYCQSSFLGNIILISLLPDDFLKCISYILKNHSPYIENLDDLSKLKNIMEPRLYEALAWGLTYNYARFYIISFTEDVSLYL